VCATWRHRLHPNATTSSKEGQTWGDIRIAIHPIWGAKSTTPSNRVVENVLPLVESKRE